MSKAANGVYSEGQISPIFVLVMCTLAAEQCRFIEYDLNLTSAF